VGGRGAWGLNSPRDLSALAAPVLVYMAGGKVSDQTRDPYRSSPEQPAQGPYDGEGRKASQVQGCYVQWALVLIQLCIDSHTSVTETNMSRNEVTLPPEGLVNSKHIFLETSAEKTVRKAYSNEDILNLYYSTMKYDESFVVITTTPSNHNNLEVRTAGNVMPCH
jgi:hypothetical protein